MTASNKPRGRFIFNPRSLIKNKVHFKLAGNSETNIKQANFFYNFIICDYACMLVMKLIRIRKIFSAVFTSSLVQFMLKLRIKRNKMKFLCVLKFKNVKKIIFYSHYFTVYQIFLQSSHVYCVSLHWSILNVVTNTRPLFGGTSITWSGHVTFMVLD